MPMNVKKKNERDYQYQKKYLKRITVWFNTKNDKDMELMNFVENFQDAPKSENIKRCIFETMEAHKKNDKEDIKRHSDRS